MKKEEIQALFSQNIYPFGHKLSKTILLNQQNGYRIKKQLRKMANKIKFCL